MHGRPTDPTAMAGVSGGLLKWSLLDLVRPFLDLVRPNTITFSFTIHLISYSILGYTHIEFEYNLSLFPPNSSSPSLSIPLELHFY
uniref:Uncharacterized protein n=1 Tax=Cucumis melo TaxID=3656 RepID=A0A9I9EM00_CUCME